MTPTDDTPRRRRKTRVWEDEHDGWCYEVTHPDGNTATGARLPDEAAARDAAKSVAFASPGPDPDPSG